MNKSSALALGSFVVRLCADARSLHGVNAAMLKMFGDIKAFSGKAEVRMLNKDQKRFHRCQ